MLLLLLSFARWRDILLCACILFTCNAHIAMRNRMKTEAEKKSMKQIVPFHIHAH